MLKMTTLFLLLFFAYNGWKVQSMRHWHGGQSATFFSPMDAYEAPLPLRWASMRMGAAMAVARAVEPEARPVWPSARTGYYAVLSSLEFYEFQDFIINFILVRDFHMFLLHRCNIHAWRLWLIPMFHKMLECVTGEPCKAPKMV